jgi:hypothetical protein
MSQQGQKATLALGFRRRHAALPSRYDHLDVTVRVAAFLHTQRRSFNTLSSLYRPRNQISMKLGTRSDT